MELCRYVIIGAGPAGIAAAKSIRKMEPDAPITLISVDGKVHSRCMLHKYLAGERNAERINFVPPDFFERTAVRWVSTEEVVRVDTQNKMVHLACEAYLPYDKLLIATGAEYSVPPIPNFREAKNVYGFRDLSDADKISQALERGNRVFIVGSGLVGLDVASALLSRGAKVTVAEMAPRVMPLQTDDTAAACYQEAFEKAGCVFRLGIGAKDSDMDGEGNITAVHLSNGETVPCDLVVTAAGVRPRIRFLEGSGIQTDRGIVVNSRLETSVPDVYAAGDVTGLSGVWPDAMEMGTAAGMNMAGGELLFENPFPMKNTSNFYGITMLSLGKLDTPDETYTTEVREWKDGYQKAVFKEGRLQGILILGDISHTGIYQHLIKNKVDLSGKEKDIFQLTFADFYSIDPKTALYLP